MSVLQTIISTLDTTLTTLNLPLKPFGTDKVEDCVCYTFYTETDDGRVRQDRLELRIIANTLQTIFETETAIKNDLVSVGDIGKLDGIQSIEVDGGGMLKDFETNTIQSIIYFTIISKSEVNI